MAILIIQHSEGCAPGLLGDVMARYGQRTVTVRVDRGERLPAGLDDLHGIVSLGGAMSVNGNDPWIEPEAALLNQAHHAGVPVLGLCLGAQMLAKALGGKVTRMPQPELGWISVRNTQVDKEDALLAGLPWQQHVFGWHNEWVSTLPEGATVLQKSERCAVQCYRVGPWSYGFQYHPEWSRQTMLNEIADAASAELSEAGTSAEEMRQGITDHYATAERLSTRMFDLCNLILFPSSRLQPGLTARSPLHH